MREMMHFVSHFPKKHVHLLCPRLCSPFVQICLSSYPYHISQSSLTFSNCHHRSVCSPFRQDTDYLELLDFASMHQTWCCQIVRRHFLCVEFPSHSERCHSRKESELTLRVSQQLNHAVLASFLCFLLQPDKEQEQKLPPSTHPKILHRRVSCFFCHHYQKCVCVCACVCVCVCVHVCFFVGNSFSD